MGTFRSFTRKELGLTSLDVLAGIVDGHLLAVGNSVVSIDLKTLAKTESWHVDLPVTAVTGRLQGRPFLSSAHLYLPCEKAIVRVDPRTGEVDVKNWPNTEVEVAGRTCARETGKSAGDVGAGDCA